MIDAIEFIQSNQSVYLHCIQRHLWLSALTILISLVIGLPAGYFCGKSEKVSSVVLTAINTFRIIPALAIFMILIPITGIGVKPSLIALTIYALPVIVINTMGAIRNVKPTVLESALAMGMDPLAICFKVEIPLAMPMIITGIKIAVVETVAGATIATFVGGGGIGEIVYMGILSGKTGVLVAGSLTIAGLVIIIDLAATFLQHILIKDFRA